MSYIFRYGLFPPFHLLFLTRACVLTCCRQTPIRRRVKSDTCFYTALPLDHFCSGRDLPHLCSHYSLSRVVCCSMMWAPGASLLPRLLTRFPALPQQLVKVMASVKIKEMHAAFMSFLLLFSSLFQPPFPLTVFPLLSPSPTVRMKVLCDTVWFD